MAVGSERDHIGRKDMCCVVSRLGKVASLGLCLGPVSRLKEFILLVC